AAVNAQNGDPDKQIRVMPSNTQGKARLVALQRDGDGWKEIKAQEIDDDPETLGAMVQMYGENDTMGALKTMAEHGMKRQEWQLKQKQINAQIDYWKSQGNDVKVVHGGVDNAGNRLPDKLAVSDSKGNVRIIDPT